MFLLELHTEDNAGGCCPCVELSVVHFCQTEQVSLVRSVASRDVLQADFANVDNLCRVLEHALEVHVGSFPLLGCMSLFLILVLACLQESKSSHARRMIRYVN